MERSEYKRGWLERESLMADPLRQLDQWIADAVVAQVEEPTAMCLSTVSAEGRPSGRFVLLRETDARGLRFYTNYSSRKGIELEGNPSAAVAFWWSQLERQLRVEGTVERLSAEESEAYFHSRPRISQIASALSPQSQVIGSREELDERISEMDASLGDASVQRPANWGGYRLVPDMFEFWQGRPGRVHDRFRYTRKTDGWTIERLAP